MKARHLIPAAMFLALGLAGCFTSNDPLITDDKAVAPYEKITFNEQGSPDDRTVLVREGKAYVAKAGEADLAMRFMPAGDDLFLAEVTGAKDGAITRLYAVLKLDRAANVVTSYKSVADKSDAGPGMPLCEREDMDMVCIEDVNAYIALARQAIDAGAEPETTYDVKLE